jgi:cell wall-associated NlpC family hydrolase
MKEIYEDLIGIPFKCGGRDTIHIDCYGLAMLIYDRLGIKLPEFGASEDFSIINQLIKDGENYFEKLEEPEPFCLVVFTIREPFVSHIGIVLEDCNKFIHVMAKRATVIERLDDLSWHHRIKGFYKWKV